MANALTAEDRATLERIYGMAFEQVNSKVLADQLFDLEGQYGRLHQKHTRLAQVSQSQMNLLDEIVSLCNGAPGCAAKTCEFAFWRFKSLPVLVQPR